jgi:hypothetical protein
MAPVSSFNSPNVFIVTYVVYVNGRRVGPGGGTERALPARLFGFAVNSRNLTQPALFGSLLRTDGLVAQEGIQDVLSIEKTKCTILRTCGWLVRLRKSETRNPNTRVLAAAAGRSSDFGTLDSDSRL